MTSLMFSYCIYLRFDFSYRLSIVLTAPIFLKQLTKGSIPLLMRYLCRTSLPYIRQFGVVNVHVFGMYHEL